MKKFEYDLNSVLTRQEARDIENVPSIPAIKGLKKIEFDSNGNIPGISNFRHDNPSVNKVHDYFKNRLDELLRPVLDPIITPIAGKIGLEKHINKIKGLQSVLSGYGVNRTFAELVGACAGAAQFLFNVFSGVDSFSNLGNVISGLANGIVNGIINDVSNLVEGLIDNALDALGINTLFNFLDNLALGDRWGDIIPNRPSYVITLINTLTGDVYRSARPNSDEISISMSSNIETTEILGRTGPLVAFANSSTTFSIDIFIHEELLAKGTFKQNLDVLKNMVHPKYEGGLLGGSVKYPKVKVILGGEDKYLCVATSLDINKKTYILNKKGKAIAGSVSMSFQVLGKLDGTLISMKDY